MNRNETINYLAAETGIAASRFNALNLADNVLAGYMAKMKTEHTLAKTEASLTHKFGVAALGSVVVTAISVAAHADPVILCPAIGATVISGIGWLSLRFPLAAPLTGWHQDDIREDIIRREQSKGIHRRYTFFGD